MPTGQQSSNSQDEIILLRRSVQYTTKLKSDPTDAAKMNQLISKTLREEGNGANVSPKSSAWPSLISKDSASSTLASSEHLDGVYDLFSLPTVSSIAPSRCD